MALPYRSSLTSLDDDRRGGLVVAVVLGTLLFGAWVGWCVFGEVGVHAASVHGRMELDRAAAHVDVPVAGQVAEVHHQVGATVEAGTLLLKFDTSVEEQRIARERVLRDTLLPEIEALTRALRAQGAVISSDEEATRGAMEEGRARVREGTSIAALAQDTLARARSLVDAGTISEAEWMRARAEAEARMAHTDALVSGLRRVQRDQKTRATQVEARVEELRRELAATESKVASANATVALLEAELAKRFVRAPVSGLIGEMRPVTVGAYLREGERFCSILPPSELRAVAEFRPEDAAGLVQVGQSAVLRIDGFPWTEFGTVPATVERVAKEPREGKVRVTLRPQLPSDARIRLEHGMTLVAEVQLERVTPLRLALRSAGGALRGKDPRPDSPSPAGRPSEGASP